MNKNIIRKETELAGRKLVLETGDWAQLASFAVKASYGDTVVLATVVEGKLDTEKDFFPLSVVYEEKMYASGSIKSSKFVKRDGRPTDNAVVIRRLIDHAIRPLFPKDYANEVQVVITVLSLGDNADPEFLGMIAASAALHTSTIPWYGPMASLKVGLVNNEYVSNPDREVTHSQSELEMMVSFVGQEKKFLAIESQSNILSDNKILGAIEFAWNNVDPIISLINDFAKAANPEGTKNAYESQKLDDTLVSEVTEHSKEKLKEMFRSAELRKERAEVRNGLLTELYKTLEGKYKKLKIESALFEVEKKIIQHMVLDESHRPDGRGLTELRELDARVGVLPRTHGSAIFERGETQSLTVTTLGNPTEELLIQDMYGEKAKRYIHYYNFPPFCTGETGKMGGAGGREIGHGMLAEKALIPVIPDTKDFPYMIMLVTEILASNGSTSMASTCGSTLALMDAGVPIKGMVAGISIGLVADVEKDKYVLLTDIMGLEDFCGHMDFKIAGTAEGITAIQLDMKVKGIPMELLPKIFEQSKDARLKILEVMKKALTEPRKDISQFAPKMLTIKIDPSQVGMIIGSGGKTIKEIQQKTGAELGIEDDGTVFISGPNTQSAEEAYNIVEGMTREIQVGEIFEGTVVDIADFGAFVEILPGKTGLLHVSEIAQGYVKTVTDFVNIGDVVKVKVVATESNGKISLSKKALEPGYEEQPDDQRHQPRHRDDRRGGGGGGGRRNNDRRR